VESNGLDSLEELFRCLNLMFLNHLCVRSEEDHESIQRTAADVWTLLEEVFNSFDFINAERIDEWKKIDPPITYSNTVCNLYNYTA